MTDPCPECAARPYLCFEHNEQQREDEETLALFAAHWEARLAREQAAALVLAKEAYWLGRTVAKGGMVLADALARLERMAAKLDPDWPSPTKPIPLFAPEVAERIIGAGFAEGIRSARKVRR